MRCSLCCCSFVVGCGSSFVVRCSLFVECVLLAAVVSGSLLFVACVAFCLLFVVHRLVCVVFVV